MASAVEQLVNNYSGDQPVSFYDYYNAYGRDHYTGKDGWKDVDPYSFGATTYNWISGMRTSAEKEYQNYLSEYEFRKNKKETAAANEATFAREDSAIQRTMADYKAAGLNPYLLISGSGFPTASTSSAARTELKRSKQEAKEKQMFSSALKLMLLVMLRNL